MSISPFRTAAVSLAAVTCVIGLTACHGKSTGGSGDTPTGSTSSSSAGTASAADTIIVKSFAFNPASLTVAKGTKVTWKFEDSAKHNVDFQDANLKLTSPDLDSSSSNNTFSYTFNTPGTFNYICGIHSFMTAKITVK